MLNRNVDLSDLTSQYTQETYMFRWLFKTPDHRASVAISATKDMGLTETVKEEEVLPKEPSSFLPNNHLLMNTFQKYDSDFKTSNLPEGKFIKATAVTEMWYKQFKR